MASVQALLRVPMADMAVTARSTSLEELPSCVLEEVEMLERERGMGRPRSSKNILHSMNNVNTLSNLSKLSGWGLSKSYNHSSVVRHIAPAPTIAQIRICQDKERIKIYIALAFFKSF